MSSLRELLDRCDLPLPIQTITALVGMPFNQWPTKALEEWYWNGYTRKARVAGGQFHRARALIQVDSKIISPSKPLWEIFTGTKLDPKQKLAYKFRGVRDRLQDDVNPAHYMVLQKRPEPKRKNKKKIKPISDLIMLMDTTGFWPTTADECLARWPELTYTKDEIDATIQSVAL